MKLAKITESTSYQITDFPIVTKHLRERSIAFFEKGLLKLSAALKDQEVTATEFKDLKRYINDPMYGAYREHINTKYFNGGNYQSVPDELYFIGDVEAYAHRIGGSLKKLRKLKDQTIPLVKDALEFLEEVEQLAVSVNSLKDKIVKKKKAVVAKETAKAEKTTKIQSHKDVQKVKKVLTEITNDIRKDVQKGNVDWLTSIVDRYVEQYDPKDEDTSVFYFKGDSAFIVRKVVDREGGRKQIETLKKDYKKIIKAEATKMTNDTLDMFIYKNTAKLSEIVNNKDNLKTVKLLHATGGRGVIEGLMELVFKDKSSFKVNNKIVASYSKLGKSFYRFPTTFHNVVLPNGEKMKSVSEAKMIKEFK